MDDGTADRRPNALDNLDTLTRGREPMAKPNEESDPEPQDDRVSGSSNCSATIDVQTGGVRPTREEVETWWLRIQKWREAVDPSDIKQRDLFAWLYQASNATWALRQFAETADERSDERIK